jgi:hypothetical protein
VRNQQSVGISTKCPAWDWVVRGNRIVGTGMYFGDPFIGGLIEENEVIDTIGYNLQIKHQAARPIVGGMPTEPRMTIIRSNRFVKSAGASQRKTARPQRAGRSSAVGRPRTRRRVRDLRQPLFPEPGRGAVQGRGQFRAVLEPVLQQPSGRGPRGRDPAAQQYPKRVRVLFNTVVHPWKGIRVLRRE